MAMDTSPQLLSSHPSVGCLTHLSRIKTARTTSTVCCHGDQARLSPPDAPRLLGDDVRPTDLTLLSNVIQSPSSTWQRGPSTEHTASTAVRLRLILSSHPYTRSFPKWQQGPRVLRPYAAGTAKPRARGRRLSFHLTGLVDFLALLRQPLDSVSQLFGSSCSHTSGAFRRLTRSGTPGLCSSTRVNCEQTRPPAQTNPVSPPCDPFPLTAS